MSTGYLIPVAGINLPSLAEPSRLTYFTTLGHASGSKYFSYSRHPIQPARAFRQSIRVFLPISATVGRNPAYFKELLF